MLKYSFLAAACATLFGCIASTNGPQIQSASSDRSEWLASPSFGSWAVSCNPKCKIKSREFVGREGTGLFLYIEGQTDYRWEFISTQANKSIQLDDQIYFESTNPESRRFEFETSDGVAILDGPQAYEAARALNNTSTYTRLGGSVEGRFFIQVPPYDLSETLSRNQGSDLEFSSSGLDGALAYAHESNEIPFSAQSFSGGTITLNGEERHPTREAREERQTRQAANQRANTTSESQTASTIAGCSKAALDAEANRFIASFGPQPSTASAAWRFTYNLTQSMIDLTRRQSQRCPNVDLNFALQYHQNNLSGLERTGRAAGWL